MSAWRRVLVVHMGALGDSVLVWPLVRALARASASVTFAARASHARLASRWIDALGITPADADGPAYARLWSGPDASAPARAADSGKDASYDAVITFVADDATPAGRAWLDAAALRWPEAEIIVSEAPGSPSREALWRRAAVATLGAAPARSNPRGPIVLHVGAGSPAKRWPLDRFLALADALADQGDAPVRLLAGEVEAERFTAGERADFAAAGGAILADLEALADELAAASLVIGNDSGPTHLSAQLGVPTLTLFGPTDPDVWAPVGPHVHVLAPASAGPIEAIPVDVVIDHAADALLAARFHRSHSDCPIITRLQ